MARVTANIPDSGWVVNPAFAQWSGASVADYIALGTELSTDGSSELYLGRILINRGSNTHFMVYLSDGVAGFSAAGPEFSDAMKSDGTITMVASNGASVTISGIGDNTEPYSWFPSNLAAVAAFGNIVAGLADQSLMVTFDDHQNEPPMVSVSADVMAVGIQGIVNLEGEASDPEGDFITYAWSANPAVGMFSSVDTPDTVWTAQSPNANTDVILTLTVSDGTNTNTASVTIAVRPGLLSIPGIAEQEVRTAANFDVQLPSATGGTQPYAYTLTGLPTGIAFNPATRRITGQFSGIQVLGLTFTVTDDGGDTFSRTFTFSSVGAYRVLIDTDEDGTYATDVFGHIARLAFAAGANGLPRQRGIAAGGGVLDCEINNSVGTYEVAQFENKPILIRKDGLYLWGGTIDDVKETRPRPSRRVITIKALGKLTAIGGNVPDDESLPGVVPASDALIRLAEVSGVLGTTQTLSDWEVEAGDDILRELRIIQEDSGTRVYEDGQGGIQLVGQGIEELWDITIAGDNAQMGDKRARWLKQDAVSASILNAAVIDGTKYTDSDSIAAHGEHLHPGAFEFVNPADAQSIAADIFSLYAQPANLYSASILLEQLAGLTNQNEVLRLLHYGNERILRVRDGNELKNVEIIHVRHTLHRGLRHVIDLQLRERDVSGISLALCTYHNRQVGYFVTLPPSDAMGRPITGHKIQYRLVGAMTWTDVASSEAGLVVNDSFTVPTDNRNYEVRAVATNSHGDQQTTPTQTLKGFSGTPRKSTPSMPVNAAYRGIRMYNDNIRNHTNIADGILGYEMEVRNPDLPDGISASPHLYETLKPFAWARFNAQVSPSNINAASNTYAQAHPNWISAYEMQRRLSSPDYSRIAANDGEAALVALDTFVHGIDTHDSGCEMRFRTVFWGSGGLDAFYEFTRGIWTSWITLDSMPEY